MLTRGLFAVAKLLLVAVKFTIVYFDRTTTDDRMHVWCRTMQVADEWRAWIRRTISTQLIREKWIIQRMEPLQRVFLRYFTARLYA